VIITLTPNPSMDRTLFIDALPRGTVIRSRRGSSEPSGKGVNVALALYANGYDTLAVLPVGGPAGWQMVKMLQDRHLDHITVPISGDIRSNISLVEPDGTVTKINEAGPVLDTAEVRALTAAALARSHCASWLVGCGSLPGGAGENLYVRLVAEGRRRGVKTAIDTSGPALRRVLAHHPDLIKPNAEELAEVARRPLRTLGDVLDAARMLRMHGAESVLASLGPDGAILLDHDGALHGEATVTTVASAVGAGDALLAGFLATGARGRDALQTGLAWAAAAVQHEGTLYPGNHTSAAVKIHDDIDGDRQLAQPQTTGAQA
jgi:1-phosphofructokinase